MPAANSILIYTDGACLGNPGPGGYAAVILKDGQRRELSAGFRHTTNNRMEVLAAVTALEQLEHSSKVTLVSDSRYLVDAMTKGWASAWKKRGWRKADKTPALNSDLWARLLVLCEKHQVQFRWVEGHAGERENERCDALSVQAARGKALGIDRGYEGGGNSVRQPGLDF